MKVTLNQITGIDDAIMTMYLSKRSWTEELDRQVRDEVAAIANNKGFFEKECSEDLKKRLTTLLRFGCHHITMLRFINFSVTVQGMHRAGQDDFDSHAKRLDNRIIRSSTRLAKFGADEMSDYYRNKIITTDAALKTLGISLPDELEQDGVTYVKTVNGYVMKEYAENKDVLRGLYMLSIPSTFMFQCNLTEWAHIYKERSSKGTANPEVKEFCEAVCDQLEAACPFFTRELFEKILN